MEHKPKVSIIIPVYQVEPYLRACLDSILAQDMEDWEAICVDDGSVDGCPAILDSYGAKDLRFRIIHQLNGGVSSARNTGLALAKGEWVSFIDPDDTVDSHYLSTLINLAENSGVDVAKCGVMQKMEWDLSESAMGAFWFNLPASNKVRVDSYLALSVGYIATWLIRCNILKKHNIRFQPGLSFCEDYHFILETISHTSYVAATDAPLYFYLKRRAGADLSCYNPQRWRQRFISRIVDTEKLLDRLSSHHLPANRLKDIACALLIRLKIEQKRYFTPISQQLCEEDRKEGEQAFFDILHYLRKQTTSTRLLFTMLRRCLYKLLATVTRQWR